MLRSFLLQPLKSQGGFTKLSKNLGRASRGQHFGQSGGGIPWILQGLERKGAKSTLLTGYFINGVI